MTSFYFKLINCSLQEKTPPETAEIDEPTKEETVKTLVVSIFLVQIVNTGK